MLTLLFAFLGLNQLHSLMWTDAVERCKLETAICIAQGRWNKNTLLTNGWNMDDCVIYLPTKEPFNGIFKYIMLTHNLPTHVKNTHSHIHSPGHVTWVSGTMRTT